jgi:riboflavin biosynthesis pyrimidine reductase
MVMIDQVYPVKRQVPLEGLYLDQRLMEMANQIGRSLVLTNFLTDQNGVVAKADKEGHFQVPRDLKNSSDWGRFQELIAQADVTISGGSYFKRLETSQDVLYPFEREHPFEKLGEWRLRAGYPRRSPDVAIVTHHLDFELPEELLRSGRRIIIFTTNAIANSNKAKALRNANTNIIGSGETDVNGDKMIDTLANDMGYGVIMMVSGPPILDLLLKAKRMDLIYVTEAQVELPFDVPAAVQTMLLGGKKISELNEFRLAHQFIQSFLRYGRKDLQE